VYSESATAVALLFPYLLLFVVFTGYPMIHGLFVSLHKWAIIGTERPFVGITNYLSLTSDRVFWASLSNSAYFTILTVPTEIALGLLLALLLQAQRRGRAVIRGVFFLPYVLSVSVVGTIWLWIFQPYFGLVSQYAQILGLGDVNLLGEPRTAMPAVAAGSIWAAVGFAMVTFTAGLQEIPEQLYEAARIDGAGKWACFRRITIPCLRRVIVFVVVMETSLAFKVFGLVFIMTQGGPYGRTRVLVQYVYDNAFQYFRMGYASAAGYLFFFVILILGVMQFRLLRAEPES